MSAYQTDSRIDDYIHTLPGWQQEICRQVRDLVHAADPEVTKTINQRALLNLFKAIIANNRAGGWRRIKSNSIPD
jgi:hypothetical protein